MIHTSLIWKFNSYAFVCSSIKFKSIYSLNFEMHIIFYYTEKINYLAQENLRKLSLMQEQIFLLQKD